MQRASYRHAIFWLAHNDDTSWVDEPIDGRVTLSVTASLVADLFNVNDTKLIADVRRELAKRDYPTG